MLVQILTATLVGQYHHLALVSTISVASTCLNDTLRTLKYTSRCRNIRRGQNVATTEDEGSIKRMISGLRREISNMQSIGGEVDVTHLEDFEEEAEHYDPDLTPEKYHDLVVTNYQDRTDSMQELQQLIHLSRTLDMQLKRMTIDMRRLGLAPDPAQVDRLAVEEIQAKMKIVYSQHETVMTQIEQLQENVNKLEDEAADIRSKKVPEAWKRQKAIAAVGSGKRAEKELEAMSQPLSLRDQVSFLFH